MMQDDMSLAKLKYYPDVHHKQRYHLGVLWVIIGNAAMPVDGISEIHVY